MTVRIPIEAHRSTSECREKSVGQFRWVEPSRRSVGQFRFVKTFETQRHGGRGGGGRTSSPCPPCLCVFPLGTRTLGKRPQKPVVSSTLHPASQDEIFGIKNHEKASAVYHIDQIDIVHQLVRSLSWTRRTVGNSGYYRFNFHLRNSTMP